MTFTRMHMPVNDTTTVEVAPGEGQVFVEDGIQHQLVLTLTDTASIDRVMAALAEVRDAMTRPAGRATPTRHGIGGGRR